MLPSSDSDLTIRHCVEKALWYEGIAELPNSEFSRRDSVFPVAVKAGFPAVTPTRSKSETL